MASDAPTTPGKRSWKKSRDPEHLAPLSKSGKRWMATAGVVFFTAILAYAILTWWLRPAHVTHLSVLHVLSYRPPRIPPNTYADEDVEPLEAAVPTQYLHRPDVQVLKNLSGLGKFIGQVKATKNDSLVVYVSAHGISDNGRALLLASNSWEGPEAASGRYELGDLLDGVQECGAPNQLLILDSGRLHSDPRLGFVVNEFPRLVAAELATRKESLYVLLPADTFQTATVDYGAQRTLFGRLVAEALAGQADQKPWGNRDRAISLKELYDYVYEGSKPHGQTPLLWHGGPQPVPSAEKTAGVWLLKLKPKPRQTAADKEKAAADAEKRRAIISAAQDIRNVLPLPSIPSAPTPPTVPPVPGLLKSGPGETKPAPADPKPAEAKPPTTPPGEAKPPAPDASGTPAKPDGAPAAPTAPEPPVDPATLTMRDKLLAAVGAAWIQRDKLQRHGTTGVWLPADYAPHRLRELEALLVDYERRARGGKFYEDPEVLADLQGVTRDLGSLAAVHEPASTGDSVSSLNSDVAMKLRASRDAFHLALATPPRRAVLASDLEAVTRARQVWNSAAFEMPDFWRWQLAELIVAGERPPSPEREMAALLKQLAVLQTNLDGLEASVFDDSSRTNLEAAVNAVSAAHGALRSRLEDRVQMVLADKPADDAAHTARGRHIESLLSTPLLSWKSRRELLVAQISAPPIPPPTSLATTRDTVTDAPPWLELKALLGLMPKLLALGGISGVEMKPAAALKASLERLEVAEGDEAIWKELRQAGSAWRDVQVDLVKDVQASHEANRQNDVARRLWLVDGRDARRLAESVNGFVPQVVRSKRDLAFIPTAQPLETAKEWKSIGLPVRAVALNTKGQAAEQNDPPDRATLKLVAVDEKLLAVRRKDRPEILLHPGDVVDVSVEELIRGTLNLDLQAKREDLDGNAPLVDLTLRIEVSGSREADLATESTFKCRLPSPERILLYAQRMGSTQRLPKDPDRGGHLKLESFPNRDTSFQFWLVNQSGRNRKVSVELWSVPPTEGVKLAPGLLFAAGDQVDPKFAEQLFKDPAARPLKMRTDLDPRRLLTPPSKIELPATANARDPYELKFTPWPAGKKEPAAGDPAPPPAPAAPAATPTDPDISQGLLCIITDEEKPDRQWLEWIELAPLHPARYTTSSVTYNAREERLQALVELAEDFDDDGKPDKILGLSKEDPVVIDLLLEEGQFAPGARVKQVKLLRANEPQPVSASAPPDGVKRRISLSADGYPRAYRYEVPCDKGGLPQAARNVEAMRFTHLAAKYAAGEMPGGKEERERDFRFAGETARRTAWYPSRAEELLVGFEVDVPENTFALKDGADRVEIKLRGQNAKLEFYSDRQVTTRLKRLTADGVLTLQAEVSDYSVPLDVGGLENQGVFLDGALWLNGARRKDAAPVEVLLDGTPPKLGGIIQSLVAGPKGMSLSAAVPATDKPVYDDLGVSRVKIYIDKNQNHVLDKEDPSLPASPAPNGELWSLDWDLSKVDLSPGQDYDLFATATDKVGWTSEAEVITNFRYPKAAEMGPKVFGVVKGIVKLKGNPVTKGRAELTLRYGEPERVMSKKTADDGSYELRGIPAGKHKLIISYDFLGTKDTVTREVIISPALPEVKLDVELSAR